MVFKISTPQPQESVLLNNLHPYKLFTLRGGQAKLNKTFKSLWSNRPHLGDVFLVFLTVKSNTW